MQSPTQLLLAAMDPIIFPLLNLAVFIETFGGHGGLMFDRAKKLPLTLSMKSLQVLISGRSELGKWELTAFARALQHLQEDLAYPRTG
jgi:hypothetical protein